MAIENEKIISIRVKTETNEQKLGQLESSIVRVQKARAELIKQSKTHSGLNEREEKELGRLTNLQQQLSQRRTEAKKTLSNLNKEQKTAVNSYDALTQRNAKLAKQLRSLADPLGKNKVKFQQLSSEIRKNTGTLAEMDAAQGRFQRNVGNYPEMLGQINPALGGMITQLKGMTKAALAFVATPLGAVLAAVAALAAPLVAFFTKTQRGIDMVDKASASLSAGFDVLVDRLSSIGEAMSLIFSGEITKGLNQLKESFKGVTDEIKKESAAAYELEKRQQALIERKREFRLEEAKTVLAIKEAEAIVNNTDFSAKARLEAINEARKLNNELATKKIEIAKEEADIISQQVALGESLNEDLDAETEARINLINVQAEQANREKRLVSQRKTLQAQADKEARDSDSFKIQKIDEYYTIKEELRLNDLDLQMEAVEEEEQLIKDGIDNEIKAQEEKNKKLEELNKESVENRKNATIGGLQAVQLASDTYFTIRKQQLERQTNDELRTLEAKFNKGELSEKEYTLAVDKIREAQFEKEKRQATIQNAINGAVAVMTSLAQNGFTPAWGIAAAGIGAAQIAQNAIIESQQYEPLQYESGGLLSGASHANGGIPFTVNGQSGFEAEGGEAIINKRSTSMFLPLLSAINQAGGGVSFDNPVSLSKFAVGGLTPNITNSGVDMNQLVASINNRIDRIQVTNVATDTASVANRVNNIQSNATFG